MTSLHRWAFSAEICVIEVKKEKTWSNCDAATGSFPVYQQKNKWFASVNIVCGSFCLQAGSTVCGEPPPLGVGDRKLWRQRHHSGTPEQRSGCGVVGQAQVSRRSNKNDCKRQVWLSRYFYCASSFWCNVRSEAQRWLKERCPVLVVSVLSEHHLMGWLDVYTRSPRSDSWKWVNRSDMWPPGRSRAFACQRSRVLFSTCRRRYLWGSCRSRSDGGTGSQCGRLTASTTTWTPNWKALCVSEERQNYGNCTLWMCQRFGVCLSSAPEFAVCPVAPWVIPQARSHGVELIVCGRICLLSGRLESLSVLSLVAAAHSSASSSLRTSRRCSWWSGGRWRRTCRGWAPTMPRNDALPQDKLSHGNFFWKSTDFLF